MLNYPENDNSSSVRSESASQAEEAGSQIVSLTLNMNKNDKRVIYFVVGSAIITPIALSVLIHLPKFDFIAGNEDSWIGFWGAYIGALITLAALFATILFNRNENRIQRHIDYSQQYKRDICEAVCSLNIGTIVDCYDQDREKHLITSVDVTRLESYKLEVINRYNTFVILYPDAEQTFLSQYEMAKDAVNAFIDKLVFLQGKLDAQYNTYEILTAKKELTKYATNTKQLEDVIYDLWMVAQQITLNLDIK